MRVTISANSDWSVTPGRSYDVLEVDIFLGNTEAERALLRVVGDDGRIDYIPLRLVATVPGHSTPDAIFPEAIFLCIPAGWVLEIRDGICTVGPRETTAQWYRGRASFWEDFFDSQGEAKRILARLLRDHYPESYERFRARYGNLAEFDAPPDWPRD